MINWDLKALNLYQQELIEQAEKDQLARDFITYQRKGRSPMAWVGHRMMEIGERLVTLSGDDDQQDSKLSYNPDISLN